jgi:hypothetical protein
VRISFTQTLQRLTGKAMPVYLDGASFENLSNDFVTWVVFYSLQDGEKI